MADPVFRKIGSVIKTAIESVQSFGDYAASESTTTNLTTTTPTPIYSFDATTYSSAKLTIQAKNTVTGEYQVSEALVVADASTAYITEYGIVYTGSESLTDITVNKVGSDVVVFAAGATTNATVYNVVSIRMVL